MLVIVVKYVLAQTMPPWYNGSAGGFYPPVCRFESGRRYQLRGDMSRPRFNSIYTNSWPYEPSEGVGLEFTGTITDTVGLIDMMWHGYSCHPTIGKEIVDELITTGVRRTTVMSHLNFDQLAKDLKVFGVTIKIVPPWEVKYSSRVLPEVEHDMLRAVK